MEDIVEQRGRVQSAPHLRLLTWEGSDAELLDLIALEDSAAAARFHERFGGDVHALVRALVGPDPAYPQLVERSLVLAYSELFRHEVSVGQLPAWVEQRIVRVVQTHLRKRWWRRLLPPGRLLLDTSSGEQVYLFYESLARLRPKWRIAFCLRYVAGRALSDTARLCDCSVSEVRRHLARAESLLEGVPAASARSGLPEAGQES